MIKTLTVPKEISKDVIKYLNQSNVIDKTHKIINTPKHEANRLSIPISQNIDNDYIEQMIKELKIEEQNTSCNLFLSDINEEQWQKKCKPIKQTNPADLISNQLKLSEKWNNFLDNNKIENGEELVPSNWFKYGDIVILRHVDEKITSDLETSKEFGRIIGRILEARLVITFLGSPACFGELRTPPSSLFILFSNDNRVYLSDPLSDPLINNNINNDQRVNNHNNNNDNNDQNEEKVINANVNINKKKGKNNNNKEQNNEKKSTPKKDRKIEKIQQKWKPSQLTETLHFENNIAYSFDVSKVMFSAGNGTERKRAASYISKPVDLVVDMFAGIGYFSVPIGVHAPTQKIICLEKNPDSCFYLRKNFGLNGVSAEKFLIFNGDNRVEGEEYKGKADHVLMGYLPSAQPFIERALFFCKESSMVHYHYVAKKEQSLSLPFDHFQSALENFLSHQNQSNENVQNSYHDLISSDQSTNEKKVLKGKFNITNVSAVKSYAPQLIHYVADILVEFFYE